MKTIKQIAEEIGVSRQAVHKKIKQEPLATSLQGLIDTVDNALRVSVDGEKIIKAAFSKKEPTTESTKKIDSSLSSVDGFLIELIEGMRGQITDLKTQNNELRAENRQLTEQVMEQANQILEQSKEILPLIAQAQELTKNAQQLHAGEMVKPQLIEHQTEIIENDKPSKKRGFFSRFFNGGVSDG